MKVLPWLSLLILPATATNVVFIMADDLGYMDVGERKNLAADHADKLNDLQAKLDAFRKDTAALLPSKNSEANEFNKW